MSVVRIRLALTLTSPNAHPIQIRKLVSIQTGRTLSGETIVSLFGDRQIDNECELEVSLSLPPTASFEFPSPPLSVSVTALAPDGKPATYETDVRPRSMSPVYRNLELLSAEYKSENSDFLSRTSLPGIEPHI